MEFEAVLYICTRCLFTFRRSEPAERCPVCDSKIDQDAAKKLADDVLALADEEKMRGL